MRLSFILTKSTISADRFHTEKINGAGLFYDPRRFFCALTGKSLFFVLKMT